MPPKYSRVAGSPEPAGTSSQERGRAQSGCSDGGTGGVVVAGEAVREDLVDARAGNPTRRWWAAEQAEVRGVGHLVVVDALLIEPCAAAVAHDQEAVAGHHRVQGDGHLEPDRPTGGPYGPGPEHQGLAVLHHTGVDRLGASRNAYPQPGPAVLDDDVVGRSVVVGVADELQGGSFDHRHTTGPRHEGGARPGRSVSQAGVGRRESFSPTRSIPGRGEPVSGSREFSPSTSHGRETVGSPGGTPLKGWGCGAVRPVGWSRA